MRLRVTFLSGGDTRVGEIVLAPSDVASGALALGGPVLKALIAAQLGPEAADSWSEIDVLTDGEPPQRYVFEGELLPSAVDHQDGGCALVGDIILDDDAPTTGLFVRLQSWEDDPCLVGAHAQFLTLVGRRLRITVETLPEEDHV